MIQARPAAIKAEHFKEALEDDTKRKEPAFILALVRREAAGADDCRPHDVLADLNLNLLNMGDCGCPQ